MNEVLVVSGNLANANFGYWESKAVKSIKTTVPQNTRHKKRSSIESAEEYVV